MCIKQIGVRLTLCHILGFGGFDVGVGVGVGAGGGGERPAGGALALGAALHQTGGCTV